MPKPAPQTAEPVNADSFLDIVASVVCIMLIMILMVGMRIKSMAVEAPQTPEAAQAAADLEHSRATEESLRGDVLQTAAEAENIARDAAARGMQRDLLATAVAAMEYDLVQSGGKVQAETQVDVDLVRRVADARRQLADLRRVRVEVDGIKPAPVVLETFPTPISRTVNEHETNFQLRNGRIVQIPWDELEGRILPDAKRNSYKYHSNKELTGTVGPVDNFKLKYALTEGAVPERLDLRFIIIPVADDLGELPEEALREGSEFRRALAGLRRGRKTVTIWVYPDSFDAFRKLRKALYEAKIEIAAWPRAMNEPIGSSSLPDESSKSAAQ